MLVLQVKAVDADVGDNAKLVYRLLDRPDNQSAEFDSSPFAVDPATGVIRATASVDREAKAVYQFHVTATDSASTTAFTSTALVTVNVLDVNDESPQFKVLLTYLLTYSVFKSVTVLLLYYMRLSWPVLKLSFLIFGFHFILFFLNSNILGDLKPYCKRGTPPAAFRSGVETGGSGGNQSVGEGGD